MAWDDFLGQDGAISLLKAYIESKRIPNGFIFSGTKGVGKFSIAKEFAKSFSCKENGIDSCDKCSNCLQIDKEMHPDIFILKPQGKGNEITIENIRDITKFLNLSPQCSLKKFFLIDEAEKMNQEASNAFLKSLEEPPLDVVIILITALPYAILPTIRSRCQEVKFSPLTKNDIKKILFTKFDFEISKADYLAKISQGSVEAALKFRDLNEADLCNEMSIFFSSLNFPNGYNTELGEQRNILREKIEYIIFLLRDSLCINVGVPQLSVFNRACKRSEKKDLIEKIEKLEYLYNALDSNVNTELVYTIIKKIWQEVCV